jgi:putative transposase
MANKAIRYRLYPNADQRIMFAKTFGCCRKVYNLMLNDKIESYKETGKFVAVTPAKYKKDYPFLKEVDSLALANVQLNLQAAFRNHFDKLVLRQEKVPVKLRFLY